MESQEVQLSMLKIMILRELCLEERELHSVQCNVPSQRWAILKIMIADEWEKIKEKHDFIKSKNPDFKDFHDSLDLQIKNRAVYIDYIINDEFGCSCIEDEECNCECNNEPKTDYIDRD